MLPRDVAAEVGIAVRFETPNVAISANPLGTVAGFQLAAVFQSPLVGLRFHVALPEKAGRARNNGSSVASKMRKREICDFISSVERTKRLQVKQTLAQASGDSLPAIAVFENVTTS